MYCAAWAVSVYARSAYIVLTRVCAPGRSASARSWACGGSSGRRRCSPAPHRAAGDRGSAARVARGRVRYVVDFGARGGTSPGCIVPRLAGQSGRLQCLAHMGMYSTALLLISVQRNQASGGYKIRYIISPSLAGRASTVRVTNSSASARDDRQVEYARQSGVLLPSRYRRADKSCDV